MRRIAPAAAPAAAARCGGRGVRGRSTRRAAVRRARGRPCRSEREKQRRRRTRAREREATRADESCDGALLEQDARPTERSFSPESGATVSCSHTAKYCGRTGYRNLEARCTPDARADEAAITAGTRNSAQLWKRQSSLAPNQSGQRERKRRQPRGACRNPVRGPRCRLVTPPQHGHAGAQRGARAHGTTTAVRGRAGGIRASPPGRLRPRRGGHERGRASARTARWRPRARPVPSEAGDAEEAEAAR